ncbi:MAG: hypothetical protein HYY44_01970, partial [Deltaproteobacteria bacterium]|nr:hypothetical protein [Deltaproteobacteria bacterium]
MLVFNPTTRDYALTSALQTANPFNTGRFYQDDWGAWKASVAGRFTIGGALEMVGTSAAFFGINRFTMPRITGALNRSGVKGFWLPLLLSSTALSMVTSGLMVIVRAGGWGSGAHRSGAGEHRWAESPDRTRDNLNQWIIGLLYSIPSTMLGMGGAQVFRNISRFLLFDAGTEVVQAFTSAGIGSALESTGLQQKRNLTPWQRVRQEFVDGVMYFGVGRGVGWAAPRFIGRLQQTYGDPAYEVGAVGDLTGLPSPRKALTPAEKAQRDLVKILKSKRKRGLTPERVPYTSEVELRVKKVREGKIEGSGVGDGDTVEVITAGLT